MSDAPAKTGTAKDALVASRDGTSAAPSSAAPSSASGPTDVVVLGPRTADGAGVHVLRAREDRLEAGELRTLQEGRPIVGEVVTLQPRKDHPRICDVTQSFAPPANARERPRSGAGSGHKGPAKVATEAYRHGWDDVFGNPTTSTHDDQDKRGLN